MLKREVVVPELPESTARKRELERRIQQAARLEALRRQQVFEQKVNGFLIGVVLVGAAVMEFVFR